MQAHVDHTRGCTDVLKNACMLWWGCPDKERRNMGSASTHSAAHIHAYICIYMHAPGGSILRAAA